MLPAESQPGVEPLEQLRVELRGPAGQPVDELRPRWPWPATTRARHRCAADPRCSTCPSLLARRVTIWTVTAPDDVRTLRTNRGTTYEGFHARVLVTLAALRR